MIRSIITTAAGLLQVLLLCPTTSVAKPALKPPPPVRYICEDGTRLRVTFTPPGVTPGTATLEILGTGKQMTLNQAAAADGGRYAGGGTELWDKGDTAQFTQGGKALSCRAKR